jgi:hypothetical protein
MSAMTVATIAAVVTSVFAVVINAVSVTELSATDASRTQQQQCKRDSSARWWGKERNEQQLEIKIIEKNDHATVRLM